jgi:hypothetical protein
MTSTTVPAAQQVTGPAARPWRGLFGALSAAIGRTQTALSDREHAEGDIQAACHGWEITSGTGRFGFGTRSYRDPRFAARRAAIVGEDYPVPTQHRPFRELGR